MDTGAAKYRHTGAVRSLSLSVLSTFARARAGGVVSPARVCIVSKRRPRLCVAYGGAGLVLLRLWVVRLLLHDTGLTIRRKGRKASTRKKNGRGCYLGAAPALPSFSCPRFALFVPMIRPSCPRFGVFVPMRTAGASSSPYGGRIQKQDGRPRFLFARLCPLTAFLYLCR